MQIYIYTPRKWSPQEYINGSIYTHIYIFDILQGNGVLKNIQMYLYADIYVLYTPRRWSAQEYINVHLKIYIFYILRESAVLKNI